MNPKEKAIEIAATCERLGWQYQACAVTGVLTISKRITPNDNDSFVAADMEYYSILGLAPVVEAGSTWGTDGGGIGALRAMASGIFTMNKSGISKRVLKAINNIR